MLQYNIVICILFRGKLTEYVQNLMRAAQWGSARLQKPNMVCHQIWSPKKLNITAVQFITFSPQLRNCVLDLN